LALALAEQHHVVIVDLNLPGIDGPEVAMEIRRRWWGAPPVLIALSGSVAEIARHQSSAVFEHAFTKPVNVDRLIEILVRQE
jgi:CheY-like chemotaxis protein